MKIVEKEEILELIKSAKNGDRIAFERLLMRYSRLIHKVNSSWGNTQDGYQEGVLGMYEAIAKYDASRGSKFSTYLYLILRKQIRRYIEKYGICYQEEKEIQLENINIENRVVCEMIIKSLTMKEKEFIALHYIQGYNLSEIAKMSNTTKQNISALRQRILAKLRKNYENNNN